MLKVSFVVFLLNLNKQIMVLQYWEICQYKESKNYNFPVPKLVLGLRL